MGPVSPDLDPQTFMMRSVKLWLLFWSELGSMHTASLA